MVGYDVRELTDKNDVLEHLRLRHDLDVAERGEFARRSHGLDLSPHDAHAHLFGLFHGGRQIGSARLVRRGQPGPAAELVRDLLARHEPKLMFVPGYLPGELVFDFRHALGRTDQLPDLELGRVLVEPGLVGGPAERALLVAMFALAVELGAVEAIGVCAADRVGAYARLCSLRQVLQRPVLRRWAAAGGGQVSAGMIFDIDTRLMTSEARADIIGVAARFRRLPLSA